MKKSMFEQAQDEVKATLQQISREIKVEVGNPIKSRDRRIQNLRKKILNNKRWWE